ncbi:secreted RxLR effector protein 161-like [Jatropha curcas]|uniref:secreted RxLR effector protein 161-like n=1 Tax=Jatropha curcas TaxID=180498 RepID=UPI0018932867|nr:secreted RxLR effector protein 161-like [Jatropha curcas]
MNVPYASVVGNLMYAQVYTRPDIAYIVGVLNRYLSNLGPMHWISVKHVLRYLQKTKDYMLIYKQVYHLEIIDYSDLDFASCHDDLKSTSRNNKSNSDSKHMEIKYFTIQDLVKKEDIEIKYIDTELKLVDPLTKGLRPLGFKGLVSNMGVVESFDVVG